MKEISFADIISCARENNIKFTVLYVPDNTFEGVQVRCERDGYVFVQMVPLPQLMLLTENFEFLLNDILQEFLRKAPPEKPKVEQVFINSSFWRDYK